MTTPIAPPLYPNLGAEEQLLDDWYDTMKYAINALRSGSLVLDGSRDPATLHALDTSLIHLVARLRPRLDGTIDALLIAQREAGGSWNELGSSTEQPLGTLRSRVKKLEEDGSPMADWARGDLNPHHERHAMDLPVPAGDHDTSTPLGAMLADIKREYAEEAAVERAGGGVRLGHHRVEFQLGTAGRDFLNEISVLTRADGKELASSSVRHLDPELEVQLVPAHDTDGGWHLRIPPHSSWLARTFAIDKATAARLLAISTADPIVPGHSDNAQGD